MRRIGILICALALVCACGATLAEGTLTTLPLGDAVVRPEGLAGDGTGGLYIFDTGSNRVCLYKDGALEVITGGASGTSLYGFSLPGYDDAAAADALYNQPADGVVNSLGQLIFSDRGNHVLRFLVDGISYTYSGEGVPGCQTGDRRNARYHAPGGLVIDSNNIIYLCDTLNHCIRTVDAEGVTAVYAGMPEEEGCTDGTLADARFREPVGIALGADGALYVSDSGNQRIVKIQGGMVTTLAGGGAFDAETGYVGTGYADGAARDARFNFPLGLCMERGVLYIADSGNHVVRALRPDGTVVTVAGSGEPGKFDGNALSASMNRPTDVYVYDDTLYIADSLNRAVRALALD